MAAKVVVKGIKILILFVIIFSIVLNIVIAQELSSCDHHVNMTMPRLTPGIYPIIYGKECIWTFEAHPGEKINLIFISLNLKERENCTSEYIALYDGNSSNNRLLGKFCGNGIPDPVISTTHILLLKIRLIEQLSYFEIQQSSGCYHFYFVEATGNAGVVSSPNYPQPYGANLLHIWEFKTHPGHLISLAFSDFILEKHATCLFDYVELYTGKPTKADYLRKYCGKETPRYLTSNRITMIFRSDGIDQYKGFRATVTSEFNYLGVTKMERNELERNLTRYLLNARRHRTNALNKWGSDITRIAVALYLTSAQSFAPYSQTGQEIAYELVLQLKAKLVMKKRVSSNDLAQFINAMTVACISPQNFFGVSFTDELRKRIDNSAFTNPYFILTLCNAGGNVTMEDVHILQQLFNAHLQISWTDTQAMVVMALKCISNKLNINMDTTLKEMVAELARNHQKEGIDENLESKALAIQAHLATENYESDLDLGRELKYLYTRIKDVKEPGVDIKEIYYILPILKFRTLLDVSSNHCNKFIKTELEEVKNVHRQLDERIQVQVTIIIGDDMDFTSTRKIKVPSDYTLYQALGNINVSEPSFKIRYKSFEGKPYIFSVGAFKASTEDGMSWYIYTKPLSSTIVPVLNEDSPDDIKVNESDEFILWYRSERVSSTADTSTSVPSTDATNGPLNVYTNVYAGYTDIASDDTIVSSGDLEDMDI